MYHISLLTSLSDHNQTDGGSRGSHLSITRLRPQRFAQRRVEGGAEEERVVLTKQTKK